MWVNRLSARGAIQLLTVGGRLRTIEPGSAARPDTQRAGLPIWMSGP